MWHFAWAPPLWVIDLDSSVAHAFYLSRNPENSLVEPCIVLIRSITKWSSLPGPCCTVVYGLWSIVFGIVHEFLYDLFFYLGLMLNNRSFSLEWSSFSFSPKLLLCTVSSLVSFSLPERASQELNENCSHIRWLHWCWVLWVQNHFDIPWRSALRWGSILINVFFFFFSGVIII